MQENAKRNDRWVVIKGKGEITVNNKTSILEKNQSIYLHNEAIIYLENPYSEELELILIQIGGYLGDDIIELDTAKA